MATKILIADSSGVDRLIIENMLKEYEVYHAKDGEEALRILQENKEIRFVLLDLQIPKISAYDVLKGISKECSSQKIRTILMSNVDDIENEIEGLRLGAVDFIRKPANFETIRYRISLHERMLHMQESLEDNKKHLEDEVYEKNRELTRANRRLSESLKLIQTIFRQVPVGILIGNIHDYHGSIKSNSPVINPKFEEITGRSQAELRHIGWKNITHPDDITKDLEMQAKVLRGEIDSYRLKKRYLRPDGSIRWVDLIACPFEAEDTNLNHLIIVEDITKEMMIEQ